MPQKYDSKEEVREQLQALGYIDPGEGSSAYQLFLAGFLKISRALKSFFRKMFGLSSK